MLLITISILAVGWVTLNQNRKDKRTEFTYKGYTDFIAFINLPDNKDIKGWLYGVNSIEDKNDNYIRLGDLFEKFEIVYSLIKAKSINDEMWYDLWSYYIEHAASAKNPNYKEFFADCKESDKDRIEKTDDIFIGFEPMIRKANRMSKNRREPEI